MAAGSDTVTRGVERASQTDLAFLAMDGVHLGEHIGVIMIFADAEHWLP